jgi:hypothetical protein
MKTALQELIDYAIDKYGSDSNVANNLICQAMILKKEERKQIEEAYDAGSGYDLDWEAEQLYYEETYKK